jgi:N utilization substance protein B
MLFQSEFTLKLSPAEMLQRFAEDAVLEEDVLAYADIITNGIFNSKEQLDQEIQAASRSWKLARMALVDLNVMRIAVFEMKFLQPPVPPNAAINEAIDIAKKYGSSDSGGFVNGILDQIAKGLRE